MTRPAYFLPLLAALTLAATAIAPGPARAGSGPAVVELFTSQGCLSCPPADRFLGQLKQRDDVIALSLHVDYWDDLGWPDPFGKKRHSQRQRAYARRLGLDNPYTPQMVVDGRLQAVGSRTSNVDVRIDRALAREPAVEPAIAIGDRGQPVVELPAGSPEQPATVWRLAYDDRHVTDVRAGENRGRELANHNVVRSWAKLGTWRGAAERFDLAADAAREAGRDGLAVLVQAGERGRILGATATAISALP